MSNTAIDVQLLRKMFLCGAQNLESNKAWINELNVFPVPDGDTGTNMGMTVVSAVREVLEVEDADDMKKVCKAISSGSLRGARGNSGVILSQLLRGFCKIVRDSKEIDVPLCADAFDKAVETAYKAVMKPKEGTILTVAKGAAEKARELADAGVTDFDEFIPQVVEYAGEVLAKTPEMLPVLKQAGVVDSGGQGLLQLFKGAYEGYQGAEFDVEALLNPSSKEEAGEKEDPQYADLKYGYVVTFFEVFTKPYNDKIDRDVSAYMNTIADQIVTVRTNDSMHVQMHTNDPGLVLQRALLYGQLKEISIVNLRCGEKFEELAPAGAKEEKPAASEGFRRSSCGRSAEEGHRHDCGVRRRRTCGHFPRSWRGLCHFRRTDDESEHGGHSECCGEGECRYGIHSSEQQEYHSGIESGCRDLGRQEAGCDSDQDRSAGNYGGN